MPGWFRDAIELLRRVLHFFTAPLDRLQGVGIPVDLFLAVGVIAVFVHLMVRMGRKAAASVEDTRTAPIRGARDERWYWARAEGFAMDGAFGPAMLAAFHAAMLRVARTRAIPLRASVTPREWIERLDLPADRVARIRPLVARLYRTAFAAEGISPGEYRAWVTELRGATDAGPA